jgi:hypothetical protein
MTLRRIPGIRIGARIDLSTKIEQRRLLKFRCSAASAVNSRTNA